VSDTPRGPWNDPLGKPLVAGGEYPTGARDPDVLIDDDGNAYLLFGVGNYYIVRLNDEMISQAEKARPIKVINAHGPGGSYGTMDDKPELHKRNGKYYLSWSSYYAVSDNVYGPHLYRGYVLDEQNTASNFHIERKEDRFGERSWEKIRIDRHGNFFPFHGQWYYVCNDSTQGEADGNPRTEAEDYFKIRSADVKEGVSGGFVVQNLTAASTLYYPRVMNLCARTSMKFYAASQDGCEIAIRQDGPEGKVLGTCKVAPTGGLDDYRVVQCTLNNEAGTANLWLTFKGKGSGEILRLDWFAFPDSAACLLASGGNRSHPGK
jgi:arabinoxylan arabinofuranohydrolase